MGNFLEFSKSKTLAWQPSGSRAVAPIDLIRQEMQRRKEQPCRLSAYIVRVTVGNEITDYQLPYQPGEVLWAVDYNRLAPVAKFFGRFKQGKFTGLKYHYSYFFEDSRSRQYVECVEEYRDGRPRGVQVYFDVQGEVTRRTLVTAPAGSPTP
jgi:hypothetical protein